MLLQNVNRPIVIARGSLSPPAGSGETAPPTSGQTITIFDSTANTNNLQGMTAIPFTRLVLSINSSANSAANGVTFEGSEDNGTNWDTMQAAQTYSTANGLTAYDVFVTSPQVRIKYANSAATLTTWRMSLIGVIGDRTKGN